MKLEIQVCGGMIMSATCELTWECVSNDNAALSHEGCSLMAGTHCIASQLPDSPFLCELFEDISRHGHMNPLQLHRSWELEGRATGCRALRRYTSRASSRSLTPCPPVGAWGDLDCRLPAICWTSTAWYVLLIP